MNGADQINEPLQAAAAKPTGSVGDSQLRKR